VRSAELNPGARCRFLAQRYVKRSIDQEKEGRGNKLGQTIKSKLISRPSGQELEHLSDSR
jgi:hypothetical protein